MLSRKLAHLVDIKKQSLLVLVYLLGLPMLTMSLIGCATVGPSYEQPSLPMLNSDYQARNFQLQPAIDLEDWWQSFADPTLNQLVSRALANNLTVQIAAERISEARANANLKGRKLLPNLDLNCEVNLCGRLERIEQAAQAELLAQEYSLQDAQRTLIADVSTSYLSIRLLQNQMEIVEKSLQLQQETTTSVSSRAEAGAVTKLDAAQTVAFLHRTRADKAVLESKLDAEFNRLGILLGESPTAFLRDFVGFGQIPVAPYLPAAGIPTDLIRRRPDIRQAEAAVGAATARIGIAKADLYPRFKLLGSISPTSGSMSPLAGNVFNFRGGNDNVQINESYLRQAIGNYRVAVLDAVKEVEDSMAMYDGYQKQLAELQSTLQSDSKAVELSLQRYEMGKSNFQRVIDIQKQMLEDSQASAEARANISIQLVKLYEAVGGSVPMQMSAGNCGCGECIAGGQVENQEDYGPWDQSHYQNEFQNNNSCQNQAELMIPPQTISSFEYANPAAMGSSGYDYSESQNGQVLDSQRSGSTVLNLDEIQPADSQLIAPPEPANHSVLQPDDFGPIEFSPSLDQTRQNSNFHSDKTVLAELFNWDETDVAVVESLSQKPSNVSGAVTASYFSESPQINNQRNTRKASSNRQAPVVWDSEAIKAD